ncbi:DUF4252 domain-containing protein [Olleya sp. HaHaR_3_96]|uniref:DUF4252 domain-containing protein n=1 Tax=Olleya sp. HaHaR_3_96 TaxID=2745560 RepID=UPI001C4FFDD2|nr:DUF4252 domain-containing protein [Olleya sp. HaHaR_3_96]QXP59530.1 DUF4252 domain-containing protein [Olleya sp. HaHaR_3_96]
MKTSIKSIVTLLVLAVVLVSCKDENSIQTYFVDHQELPDFMSFDVSTDVIDFSKANLTEEEQEAYQSVNKLDILAYKSTAGNVAAYTEELAKAKVVFGNKKYEELMEFKDNGVNVKINVIENGAAIDEFLVLASSKEMGFTILRIIGDNMKPEQLIKLSSKLQNADIDKGEIEGLMSFFK